MIATSQDKTTEVVASTSKLIFFSVWIRCRGIYLWGNIDFGVKICPLYPLLSKKADRETLYQHHKDFLNAASCEEIRTLFTTSVTLPPAEDSKADGTSLPTTVIET